ncbi:hypothetical protein FRX31_008617 [Thalictrum thalictroides]|uniref:TF-B3 domain-containing protein n=1 Tax=Thalictrum thalictroides TaxID=46969 RepID=A0A7J6WWH4_THATH|nr:hypothetical protein FRX31_008617 [Thalictrum thalictroides]
MMLLDPCGRSWPVTIYHKKEGGTMMTGGWSEFCAANRLNTNDICIFLFIEGMGEVIRVEISRTRIKAPSANQASADMAISTYTPKEVIETPTGKRPEDFVVDQPARESIKEECAELGFNLKESDEVNRVDINSFKCNERSIIAARAFTSDNPFCTITMRPTYVSGSYSLNIPKDFANKYLKDAFQGITLRHSNRGSWHAGYRAGHRKLGKGWKEFVFANHLQVNDICIFELVDKIHIEFEVFIYRVNLLQHVA